MRIAFRGEGETPSPHPSPGASRRKAPPDLRRGRLAAQSLALVSALAPAAAVATPVGQEAGQETPFPELTGRVVDAAGILSADDRTALEAMLAQLERETTVQVVIASLPRIEGAIEDYSLRLAEHWGIGQAETDNGALVLVSMEDRRARIEVGYGLEGAIPDGLAGRIIRDELAPPFASGDYAAGFAATAAALAQAARGEYRGAAAPAAGGRGRGRGDARSRVWPLLFFGGFILLQLLGYVGNAFHPAGAAALGGGLAALLGLLLLGGLAALWLAPLGLLAGFGATAFTRATAGRASGWGYAGIPGGGGMAFRGGGGFGGGFGGFAGGGGGFGGGGASGSW